MRTEPIGAADPSSDRFGALFCGVLGHVGGNWGYCSAYFSPAGTPATLAPLAGAQRYRVVVVPGIFGQCVENLARPFEDAARHLRAEHQIDVEYISVSALGSSAHNARQIRDYLTPRFAGSDRRPYIAFGYSKGASDLIEAVSDHAIARTGIAAIVTVAGSVLGSRLTQGVPRDLVKLLQDSRIGTCDIGDGGGIDSLRRSDRVAALARFSPPAGFRSYSVAAVSDAATTSAALTNGWRQLLTFSLEQDSQVLHEDAVVPRATYLGMAKGDHWAVALPFEDVPSTDPLAPIIARSVNRNHYPRAALFEAALRFVLDDLP